MTTPQKDTAGSERAIREALSAGPTPGEWTTAKSYGSGARCSVKAGLARIAVPSVTNINWEANAALIAACNPEAIAALLAELDRLRASQPSGAAGGEVAKHWCDTCEGTGKVHQEHQAGCWVGGDYPCPDCDGKGYWTPRASLASPSSGGWQWVPVEPTEEMVRAGNKKTWPLPSKDVYRAMLAVLPPAPKSSGESHE